MRSRLGSPWLSLKGCSSPSAPSPLSRPASLGRRTDSACEPSSFRTPECCAEEEEGERRREEEEGRQERMEVKGGGRGQVTDSH